MANSNGGVILALAAAGLAGVALYTISKGSKGLMASDDLSHSLITLNTLPRGTGGQMGEIVTVAAFQAHEFIADPEDFYPGAFLLLDENVARGRQIIAQWMAYVPSSNLHDIADVRLWHEQGGRVVGTNTPMPKQDVWVAYTYVETVLPDARYGLWLKFNARASSISDTGARDILEGRYDRIYIRDLVVGMQ